MGLPVVVPAEQPKLPLKHVDHFGPLPQKNHQLWVREELFANWGRDCGENGGVASGEMVAVGVRGGSPPYLKIRLRRIFAAGMAALECVAVALLCFDSAAREATEVREPRAGRGRAEARAHFRTICAVDGDVAPIHRRHEGGLREGLGVPVELARVVVHEHAGLAHLAVHLELIVVEAPAEACQVWWRWRCRAMCWGKQLFQPTTVGAEVLVPLRL